MKIAIILGTGLENLNEEITSLSTKNIELKAFYRHGAIHMHGPNKLEYDKIKQLKEQGFDCIIAFTAVGSLQDKIEPQDFIIINDFIDLAQRDLKLSDTKHLSMVNVFDSHLSWDLFKACNKLENLNVHKGVVITIKGPRFSTISESKIFKQWADVINMTTSSEAIMAKYCDIKYSAIGMVTDYDNLFGTNVDMNEIMKNMKENKKKIIPILKNVVKELEQ